MSIKLIVQIMEECDLPRPWASVLIAMADHADDDGNRCFPSVDRIAWKANYKPRQVSNIIRDMTDAGILTKVRDSSRRLPVEYKINVENTPQKLPFDQWKENNGRHAISQQDESMGAISQHLGMQSHNSGVQSHNSRDATHCTLTVKEPSVEPSVEPSGDSRSESPSVEDMFKTFWQAYPKPKPNRHSRKESLAKFKGALKKASFEEIMDGLEWFKVQNDWTKDGGQYIPGAQRWLNQEMWEAAKEPEQGLDISPSNQKQPEPATDVDWGPDPNLAWMLDPSLPKPWEKDNG